MGDIHKLQLEVDLLESHSMNHLPDMSSSSHKDVPNLKGHVGKMGATAESAKYLLEGDAPESVDDAIRKIKAMATERIRQKAAAHRAALDLAAIASGSSANGTNVDSAIGADINSLTASVSDLNIDSDGPINVEKKQDQEDTDEISQKAKSVSAVSITKIDTSTPQVSTATKDVKSGDTKVLDIKSAGVAKVGAIIVPKTRPKTSEPKLPQTEDGFAPQPWVKRRYTIAQLLLLGEIVPYVVCPRDRFNIQVFTYDIVHIPGLGNESTGNAVVDHQILTLNLRTELIAFQFFTTYGYRYLERFKSPDHTLFVKGLWVEVRGSAGLRDHGGYRNAYRPKPYAACIKEGLIKENQEAEVFAAEQRNNHTNTAATQFRGRGGRGGPRGGGYRGGSARGGHRPAFTSASNDQMLMMREDNYIPIPALNPIAYAGPPTPIVRNDIAEATAKEAGTLRDFSKEYADIQLARTGIDHVASKFGGNAAGDVVDLVEQAKGKLAEKKAEITNKWGEVYGYTVQEQKGEPITKPGGLQGNFSTQEQQMQYIQYMLQTPLAPVLSTTHAAGNLTPSVQLAQPSTPMSDEADEA
ncbi:hypothetical protein TWF696_005789 [Orbilia brochopaga]|uniref:Uncharacterized protein n=1 Tax=Orbilia brochopaga TaxID=3140254 RepID=A0AAV9UUD3_9PEZI